MAPNKTKGRNTTGLSTPVSLTKRPKRAGSKKLVSDTIVQGQHLTFIKKGMASRQDDVSYMLVALMRSMSYSGRPWPDGGGGDEDEAGSTVSVTVGYTAFKDFCFHNLDYDPDHPLIVIGIPLHQHSFLEPPTILCCPRSQQGQGLVERDRALCPLQPSRPDSLHVCSAPPGTPMHSTIVFAGTQRVRARCPRKSPGPQSAATSLFAPPCIPKGTIV